MGRSEANMTDAVHKNRNTSPRRNLLMVPLGAVWAILLAVALVALSRADLLPEGPDEWTYDWRTYFFSQQALTPRNDIAVILINEKSLSGYDYLSPVDRGMVASLLRALDAARPAAIGLDFIYDRKSEAAKTDSLIEAMRQMRAPIVLGAIDRRAAGFDEDSLAYQKRFLTKVGRDAGHVFFAIEKQKLKLGDQVVRYRASSPSAPNERPSFAAQLARIATGRIPAVDTRHIAWTQSPEGGDLFPLFRVPSHEPGSAPEVILPKSWWPALKGKIVLIGGDFAMRDKHLTPFSIAHGERMPGVLIHGQILAQFLDARTLYKMPDSIEIVLLALAAFIGFILSWRGRIARYEWIFYFSGLAILIGLGILAFAQFSLVAPSTTLFFAWTLGVTGGHYAPRLFSRTPVPS